MSDHNKPVMDLNNIQFYEIWIDGGKVIGMNQDPLDARRLAGFSHVWRTRRGNHHYVIVSNDLVLTAEHAIYFAIAVEEGRVSRKTVNLLGLGRYDN